MRGQDRPGARKRSPETIPGNDKNVMMKSVMIDSVVAIKNPAQNVTTARPKAKGVTAPAAPSPPRARLSLRPPLAAALLLLAAAPSAGRAADPAAPGTAPPAACTPVARIYGDTLCRERLGLDRPATTAGAPPPGAPQGPDPAPRLLREALWNRALLERFAPADVVPTEDDVDSLSARIRTGMAARHEADRQTATYLSGLLEKNTYRPEDEQALRDLAQASALSVRFYQEQEQRKAEIPPEYEFVTAETERQVALTMLSAWKADRLLLKTYGGRLVRTGAGLVPADARRAFIRDMRRKGGMEILDPALSDIFTAEEKSLRDAADAPGAEIVPENSPLYKAYLSDPGWRFGGQDTVQRMESLRAWAESLPAADGPPAAGKAAAPRP